MRLIDIKQCIDIAYENYKYTTYTTGVYRVDNIQQLKIAIQCLIKAGFISEEDDFIKQILYTQSDFLTCNSDEYSRRMNILTKLKFLLDTLYKWVNEYVPGKQDADTINIKLPQLNNFDELNKVSNELRLAFSTVINEYEGGKIEIVQFDHGSFWCVIKVGTALLLFTGLAWAGAVVAKKTIECENAYEVYRNAAARNDMLEELKRLNKAQIDLVIEQEAKLIQQEYFNKEDNEQLERIKNSIYNISELIFKGTEVQPALAAPEDVKNLFPDFTRLPFIESKVKKIAERCQ